MELYATKHATIHATKYTVQRRRPTMTAYISHPDCLLHQMERGHPEAPLRLHSIADALIAQRIMEHLISIEAPLVEWEDLYRAHDPNYVEAIRHRCPQVGSVMLGPDVLANEHTLTAARRAAGAAIKAVDMVMRDEVRNAFCAVRPPGHHAERDRAMGFCLFNNVAVAAAYALERYAVERIAIVDFDVHHGNGTENIVQDDSRILFCSSYQHPYYPFSVPDNSRPNIIHTPLNAGISGRLFRHALSEQWFPALEAFQPELILISAGFDAHYADELGGLELNESDYEWVTEQIKRQAEKSAQGRIVSCLEGGYNLEALGRSVAKHLKVLAGLA